MNKYSSFESRSHSVRKLNSDSARYVFTKQIHICAASFKLHEKLNSHLDTDHERSFKCNQPTAHQYAAATLPLSPNYGNKQAEKVEGSIDVCSFMRIYHSRPTYAQKRSNKILSYQIEFFTWLISFRGGWLRLRTANFKRLSGFHLPLGWHWTQIIQG